MRLPTGEVGEVRLRVENFGSRKDPKGSKSKAHLNGRVCTANQESGLSLSRLTGLGLQSEADTLLGRFALKPSTMRSKKRSELDAAC